MKSDFTVKKILLLLLVLVILFIPTYIAIGSYKKVDPPSQPDVTENTYLIVKDPKQNETRLEKSASGNSEYELFTSILENASEITELPETVSKSGNMLLATFYTEKITTDENGIETRSDPVGTAYAFYFSTNKKECYFTDPEKKVYHIDEKDAQSFLSNAMAAYLYNSAVLPVFSFMGTELTPDTLEWNYLAAGNVYKTIAQENTSKLTVDYKSGDSISTSFSIVPTDSTVKVTDSDGNTLYDASCNGFSAVSLDVNTKLFIEITANWGKTDGCEAYGKAVYKIEAELIAPPVFSISLDKIYQGEFTAISVMNVRDASAINFSSTPALPYIPTFYLEGNVATALIPVSYGCVSGDYELTVSYGGTSETLGLTVDNYRWDYKESKYTVAANIVNTSYTDAHIAAYDSLVKQICALPSSSAILCSGKFINYETAGALQTGKTTLYMGFGRHVTINGSLKSFEHTGVDFSITSKDPLPVPALNSGVVIAAGSDGVLGNYVVIDHGCGLRTWYAHLTAISVNVGDYVEKAAAVGTTASSGCTGFTIDGKLHVGVSVGNQFVAPYDLWEKGVSLPSFY